MIVRPPLALALLLLFPHAAPAAPPPQGCGGCSGSGATATASGGSCGGKIQVSVTVQKGTCKWILDELLVPVCRQTKGCTPTIRRHWENLPPNSPLDFCVTLVDGELCLQPPPNAGATGSGDDERVSAEMACSDHPDNTREYCIAAPSCGLEACAEAKCSACSGA